VASEFQADIDAIAGIAAVPRILDVAARTTGMGWACVARVTENRWINCMSYDSLGWNMQPGDELDITTTVCDMLRRTRQSVAVDHVAQDDFWGCHPIPAQYGFQSYISVPIIRADGSFFGTLCALDPEPRKVDTPEIRGMFALFAELIAHHIDAGERVERSEAELRNERRDAELREQFIAVLGHDLRSPVAAVGAGARALARAGLDERNAQILRLMQSSVSRMAGLIDNLLDFARGRLGGGIPLERDPEAALHPVLETVIGEQETGAGREIIADLDFDDPVDCDPARIGQLFANLLANAVTHGAPDRPIRVGAAERAGALELWVENGGAPIPPGRAAALFKPFVRGSSRKGLGLGLFIASEIAEAHGGDLRLDSTPEATRFTFRLPRT
jgi:signal transduction histidine kinase